ncbi:aminomethyltransferase [Arenicella chitinivorans]|uniref:Aminomethyltransferase n=1 Tax=Arenicella chitinivorans TaxID=1329800 RepID=A0A918RRU5_9GAMM|nr:aminomethyltransferase [Arenicella chitinivorans]
MYAQHKSLGAKLVDFGGWALPVNYGSQIDEHHAVRTAVGMFDVSHMTVSDVTGPQCLDFLRRLLANDIDKVSGTAGKALYSCMLNTQGGVIDDLIVYYLTDTHCRMVTNAATNEKDMAWLAQQAKPFDVTVTERPELALLAVQGPDALKTCATVLEPEFAATVADLARFQGKFCGDEFVGRTGYTGEDGVEFIVSAAKVTQLWEAFLAAGVQPCGLGARDTLRLESGMALYGNDLDETHTPLESGLKWTVSLKGERDFIGRGALDSDSSKNLIGLILQDRGVLRSHQTVFLADDAIGEITSGSFSPTLQQSIALARVNCKLEFGQQVQIQIRNKRLNATVARYPFVKDNQPTN